MATNREQSETDSASEISLDLSYASSVFDDGDGVDEGQNLINEVAPYQFEPYEDENPTLLEENYSDPDEIADRIGNNNWCTCGHCIAMPTNRESLCCAEISRMLELMTDNELDQTLSCVTLHPGFEPVCLNTYVLQTAYLQYRQQYGEEMQESNEKYRYTAYRQLARWAWGYLGKHVRVVLPSCAVNIIRTTFPDSSEAYKGFQLPS